MSHTLKMYTRKDDLGFCCSSPGGGGGYFIINSYGGVRRKDFCYDPIPEIWSDIDTQSQNICQILIPNRRSDKSNLTSKGLGIEGWERLFWFQVAIGTKF